MSKELAIATTATNQGVIRRLSVVMLVVGLIMGVPVAAFSAWWAIRQAQVKHFEQEAITVLAQVEPKEDLERRVYFHRWDDGSWILTRFSEECCGDNFDAHVLRASDAGIFIAPGAHYCGYEGLMDACRHTTSAANFRQALERQHARLIPVAAPQ